ncbi:MULTISPECIES: serine/threonine-protein kinase [unclassified Streptomyces]|uniref:serine/threonine-protein kinase n=1 Tax=unclassified Streptomyces TaxID=2593676 RepID=UPI00278C0127|nr:MULTISPECIES: serine/threonine-protein kinase [unclassified Streptomyces]
MKPLGIGDPLRLGPYRVLGVLGEGGMGKVYVGQDGAATLAAVKVLKPELAHDPNLAQRFVREAQAAQAVRSKGVANVLGAWTEGGRPWMATEFLAGLTLDQAVEAHGPLDEPALRALAASLAHTLADIHAAGFIHRDLKPPNIVLTSTGPRVIDFGIARPEHGLTLTTTGEVPVTPGYGAPEQVLGHRVTPAADVFSLGAVLVYAASGRRAFDGGHVAAVQYEVVHGEPQLHGIAPELTSLIAPCLAKDPAHRPTPAQIAEAMRPPKGAEKAWRRGSIAAAITERETGARQLSTTIVGGVQQPQQRPAMSRRRLLTTLAVGGTVAAAGAGTAAWWYGSRDSRTRTDGPLFDIPAAAKTPVHALKSKPRDNYAENGGSMKLWSVATADVTTPELLPVRDVLVFALGSGGIGGHSVKDGKRRWAAEHLQPKSGYVSLADRLVVGADDEGTLHTYVPATGKAKWTCAQAEAATLLAADADAVYLTTKDDRLRCVGASDAKVRWTVTVPAKFRGKLHGPAAVARGVLVVPTTSGTVHAVRTSDGSTAWRRQPDESESEVRPLIVGGTVYINGKTMQARALTDGKLAWSTMPLSLTDAAHSKWGPPEVSGSHLYVSIANITQSLRRADGQREWFAVGPSTPSRVRVQGSAVWVGDDGDGIGELQLRGIPRKDGENPWTARYPRPHYSRLAADGNRIFLLTDGTVHALSAF